MDSYKNYNSKISLYIKWNISIIVIPTLQLSLMIWALISNIACHQGIFLIYYSLTHFNI
jgi:hypothetical protein